MTRAARLAVALLLARPAAAAPSSIRNPGVLVHLTTRPWFTLDPAQSFDAVSFILTGNVYEPLIAIKSLHDVDSYIPFLASAVPTRKNGLLSADGLEYRFPIRKGVHFHEGQELTPEDVRYSILRFMLQDPAGGPSSLLLKPILGIYTTRSNKGALAVDFRQAAEAVRVDEDAVIVHLKRPSAHFLKIIASLPIIVSKPWCVAHGEWDGGERTWRSLNGRPAASSYLNDHANGTGAFRVETLSPDKEAALARFEGYWRKPAALSRVLLRVVPNKALRLWMLENGDADSSYLEDQDFAEAREIPDVSIVDYPAHTSLGESLFFTFETAKGSEYAGSQQLDGAGVPLDFFRDKDVREGFAHALDYDGYLRRGMGMRGKRAPGPFPDAFLEGQSGPIPDYSLEKAGQCFRRAYGGQLWEKGFTLTLAYNPSVASRRVIAELLRAALEKINPKFNLRIKTLPGADFYAALERHELPLFISSYYADYPDPQSMAFGLLHSSGYYPQAQRYYNAKLDHLIEQAETEQNASKRRSLYLQISRLAEEDMPQIHTFNPTRFRAARSWVVDRDAAQDVANLNLNNFPYFYVLSKP
ncbi:MAG TPA: ABC transporter substrate-binding protein [Elusimicrobiota bacterium]|jgi:peptide/nickel transport system substrate-binding protein|nr:ABC transporter substrate-binding protein [Elusimicrobiota bacterium]